MKREPPGAPFGQGSDRAADFEAVGASFKSSSSPWAQSLQLPPCPRSLAFRTAGHIVALAASNFALIAVRPFYIDKEPHRGLWWRLEPADESIPSPAVANFAINAGIAGEALAEGNAPAALARAAGKSASDLIWRHRKVVRAIAAILMTEMYIGTERLRELLRPVIKTAEPAR